MVLGLWRLQREQQPAPMAGQLRIMAAESTWLAGMVARHHARQPPFPHHPVGEGREELARLQGAHSGTTAEVARTLLEHLSRSAELIDQALAHTAAVAVAAGVAP